LLLKEHLNLILIAPFIYYKYPIATNKPPPITHLSTDVTRTTPLSLTVHCAFALYEPPPSTGIGVIVIGLYPVGNVKISVFVGAELNDTEISIWTKHPNRLYLHPML
jgi:hypothetical protein